MQFTKTKSSLETYLALAVHDLKTPINAQILAATCILQTKKLPDDLQELINDILGSAKYLKDLVDNILTKYQMDINAQKFNIKVNSVGTLLDDTIEGIKYLIEEKNINLVIRNNLKNSNQKFDYIEIKRVLTNLIANAIDFTREKVILKISETQKYVRFSVADFGYGIRLDNPDEIFSKDLTLSQSQKRLGTGLGLFIAKQIVLAHGGKISVKTRENFGTVISFILPK